MFLTPIFNNSILFNLLFRFLSLIIGYDNINSMYYFIKIFALLIYSLSNIFLINQIIILFNFIVDIFHRFAINFFEITLF
jgi:hypothetical protein